MSKSTTIAFKVTPREKQLLTEAAQIRGLSVSAYCSNVLLDQVDDEEGAYLHRGNRILSADDLDDIAGRVSLELNAIGEELAERIAGQIQPPAPVLQESWPDLPEADLIGGLELPAAWAENLRSYVQAAAVKLEVSEQRILTIMLAKAYSTLKIAHSAFFSDAIGNWNEDELEQAFLESKVETDG